MSLSIFATAVNAIFPIIAIILLGFCLKRAGFLSEAFLSDGNRLVFHFLLPVMLFFNVYKTEDTAAISWDLIGYCVCAMLVLFVLGMALVGLVTKDPRQKGVLLQNFFRSNTSVIGIALAEALGGQRGRGRFRGSHRFRRSRFEHPGCHCPDHVSGDGCPEALSPGHTYENCEQPHH